jgi:hypothetical protein
LLDDSGVPPLNTLFKLPNQLRRGLFLLGLPGM